MSACEICMSVTVVTAAAVLALAGSAGSGQQDRCDDRDDQAATCAMRVSWPAALSGDRMTAPPNPPSGRLTRRIAAIHHRFALSPWRRGR